ncbi:MAG: efflux RND transporter permease subunit [Ignavibacteriaceae bacterium]|nr:efflux RND transporter permease subunit [Ignavibacteriaceae bacterium]
MIVYPDKLLKYDITVDDVFTSIENNNKNVGGSIIERYSEQYIVRGVGLIKNIPDLENIVLKSYNGTPVYVKNVADVQIGEAVRQGAAIINGKEEAVGGIVMMLRGENSREVVGRVKEKVKEINDNNILPDGIKIVPYYDRTDIVDASVSTVTTALIEGSILVLIILYLLLRSFRGSVVVLYCSPAFITNHLHCYEISWLKRKSYVAWRISHLNRNDNRCNDHPG